MIEALITEANVRNAGYGRIILNNRRKAALGAIAPLNLYDDPNFAKVAISPKQSLDGTEKRGGSTLRATELARLFDLYLVKLCSTLGRFLRARESFGNGLQAHPL